MCGYVDRLMEAWLDMDASINQELVGRLIDMR